MNKLICTLFLIFTQLSASSSEMKIKAVHKGDTVFVKGFLGHKKSKNHFISHIKANISDKIVFDAYITPYLKSMIHFSFMAREKHDVLTIATIDNRNKEFIKNITIKKRNIYHYQENLQSSIELIDYRKEKPKIWNSTTIEKATKELYGTKKIIHEPEPAQICGYSGGWIRLPIKTGKSTKSIAVFKDHSLNPIIAIFNTLINEENTIILNISTERNDTMIGGKSKFIIIYEDINGNLHHVIQNFEVAGHHESCNRDTGKVTNML